MNFLVFQGWRLKLCDFGLSVPLVEELVARCRVDGELLRACGRALLRANGRALLRAPQLGVAPWGKSPWGFRAARPSNDCGDGSSHRSSRRQQQQRCDRLDAGIRGALALAVAPFGEAHVTGDVRIGT